MTSQCPDILIVDTDSISLPDMQLYGVHVGDIDRPRGSSGYAFKTSPNEKKMTECSALWRGYVSVYRLKENGVLALERMEYPFSEGVGPDQVNEILKGDFWVELRVWFMGDKVRVPFQNGRVQLDRSTWRFVTGLPLPRQRPK